MTIDVFTDRSIKAVTIKTRNHLLYALTLLFMLSSCNYYRYDKDRVIKIGQSIIAIDTNYHQSPHISDVVAIGPYLFDKIVLLRTNAKTYNFNVRSGDFEYPHGEGKADCILTIDTDYQDVGIRLRYSGRKDKYEILGFMTL